MSGSAGGWSARGASVASEPEEARIGSAAFRRELERARRHLAKLEAEQALHLNIAQPQDDVRFDESPLFARTCNLIIWAIVLTPFVLALAVLARRLIG